MKEYELMFIIQPEIGEEKQKATAEKMKAVIEANEGKITKYDFIGKKELASELNGYKQGVYVLINYLGTAKTNQAINDTLKVTEEIFRNLLVTMDSIKAKEPAAA